MTKEMIISSSAHETRVAILEDDQVAEIFIEREHQRGVVGNLYKGRVSKVLPGMQSAFVDLGLERDGFLYVSDVVANTEETGSKPTTTRRRAVTAAERTLRFRRPTMGSLARLRARVARDDRPAVAIATKVPSRRLRNC